MKSVVYANIKGGVGKSMCLFQNSAILSERGKKILLVDGDPQHSLTIACLGRKGREIKQGLYELLLGECKLEDVIVQPYPDNEELQNIYLIPSNYDLFMYEKDPTDKNQIYELSNKLNRLKNFDYVMFDTNPSVSFILTSILAYAENIISVFDASHDAIEGFIFLKDNLIKQIQASVNKKLEIKGIILNNHKVDSGFSKDIIQIVDNNFPNLRFETVIKGIYKNKDSRAFSEPMIIHDRKNASTLQWIDLTTEILKRIGE